MSNNDWKKVGVVGVDAGLCWLGDPCYIISDHCDAFDNRDWHAFLTLLNKNERIAKDDGKNGTAQFNYEMGHAGLGVCVTTGCGDGTYPVYIKRDPIEGVVAEVKVVFIDEDEEEEE